MNEIKGLQSIFFSSALNRFVHADALQDSECADGQTDGRTDGQTEKVFEIVAPLIQGGVFN